MSLARNMYCTQSRRFLRAGRACVLLHRSKLRTENDAPRPRGDETLSLLLQLASPRCSSLRYRVPLLAELLILYVPYANELTSKKSRGERVRFLMTGVQCLFRLLVNQFELAAAVSRRSSTTDATGKRMESRRGFSHAARQTTTNPARAKSAHQVV